MTVYLKKLLLKGITLLVVLCTLVFALFSFSFAWFYDGEVHHFFEGHAILGYFDSGTGSENDPYIIATPQHFYHLAWLQDIGVFTANTHFKIRDDVKVLDMAGDLTGIVGRTGALPPIGTSSQPFIGTFDGNGAVIKNLWISSDPEDWYEKPANHERCEVGTDIGMFGKIGNGANVSNFFVENIEVTTAYTSTPANDVNLGIVAGYVDGNLSKIGVKNAKLSFKEGSVPINSEFSLVGHMTGNVNWGDMPSDGTGDGAGGELVVIPKPIGNSSSVSGVVDLSPDALPDHAYYVGPLEIDTPKPQPGNGGSFKYVGDKNNANDDIITFSSFGANQTIYNVTARTSAIQGIDLSNETTEDKDGWGDLGIEPEFVTMMDQSTKYAIFPSAPTINSTTINGLDAYPTGCIWFKPISKGNVTIAFTKQNNGNDYEYMSIYRYARNANGTLDTSKPVKEIVLALAKDGIGTGGIAYFDLFITQEEIDAKYEYVIGRSSNASSKTTAGFVFLKLAGVNITGGDAPDGSPYRTLEDVDFVSSTTNVDLANLSIHKSILDISGTQSSAGAIYYDAKVLNSVDTVVYRNASSLTIAQSITNNPQAKSVTEAEHTFPPREDTLT